MRPLDPALLRRAPALRRYLMALGLLGALSAALILGQAQLLSTGIARTVVGGGDLAALRAVVPALLVVAVLRAATAWLTGRAGTRASYDVRTELRRALLVGAMRRGPAWLAGERAGELALTATTGLDALDGYVVRYMPQLVLAVVVPVALLVRIGVADPTSAVVLAVTVPLIPVFMVLVGMTAQRRMRSQWALLGRLSGHFLDVVEGLTTLRVFGRAHAQVANVRQVTERYRSETMATLRIAFLSALVLELLASLSVALVAVSVGLRLVQGRLGLGTALLVLLLAPEVYLPLRQVGMAFHACADGLEAASRALDVAGEALPGAVVAPAAAGTGAVAAAFPDKARGAPSLRVEQLTVVHDGRTTPALDAFSLTVAPGEVVALTGPSGAGKSTLVSVLLGFLEPASGRVLLDGHPVGAADREAIAWVPQRPRLPGRTVRDVVRLGTPGAGDAAVTAALRAVGAGFVTDLGQEVGEDGLRFSTGQRRRLAVARAVLRVEHGARLLLLDEPGEGLDPGCERDVAAAVRALRGRVTVLLVTHSATLVAAADRAVELPPAAVVRP